MSNFWQSVFQASVELVFSYPFRAFYTYTQYMTNLTIVFESKWKIGEMLAFLA